MRFATAGTNTLGASHADHASLPKTDGTARQRLECGGTSRRCAANPPCAAWLVQTIPLRRAT
jgi:hypothetical protein